jgi:hypothetical protein
MPSANTNTNRPQSPDTFIPVDGRLAAAGGAEEQDEHEADERASGHEHSSIVPVRTGAWTPVHELER